MQRARLKFLKSRIPEPFSPQTEQTFESCFFRHLLSVNRFSANGADTGTYRSRR
jgi:hypothetical protein